MGNVRILTNALLAVGTGTSSADRILSGRLKKLTWNEEFDDHDVTCMGTLTRVRAIGIGKADISFELMQSYSTADAEENVDKLVDIWRDLSATGKKFLVRIRPDNSARNDTNPEYQMLSVMAKRTIFDGSVGDPLMNSISFLSAGDILRVTATT